MKTKPTHTTRTSTVSGKPVKQASVKSTAGVTNTKKSAKQVNGAKVKKTVNNKPGKLGCSKCRYSARGCARCKSRQWFKAVLSGRLGLREQQGSCRAASENVHLVDVAVVFVLGGSTKSNQCF